LRARARARSRFRVRFRVEVRVIELAKKHLNTLSIKRPFGIFS